MAPLESETSVDHMGRSMHGSTQQYAVSIEGSSIMQVTVKRNAIAPLSARVTITRKEHGPLIANALMHLVNDGCFVAIYPVLPLIAKEFHLSYTQVGFLKTALSASSTALQLPMAMLAERFGDVAFLALGMAWVAGGLMVIGLACSFLHVFILTFCCGSGCSVELL